MIIRYDDARNTTMRNNSNIDSSANNAKKINHNNDSASTCTAEQFRSVMLQCGAQLTGSLYVVVCVCMLRVFLSCAKIVGAGSPFISRRALLPHTLFGATATVKTFEFGPK